MIRAIVVAAIDRRQVVRNTNRGYARDKCLAREMCVVDHTNFCGWLDVNLLNVRAFEPRATISVCCAWMAEADWAESVGRGHTSEVAIAKSSGS